MGIEDVTPVINNLSTISGLVERFLPEPLASFAKTLSQAKEDITVDIAPEYRELIEKQMEVQAQMQEVTFVSNIERVNHETRMAPVRNIRGA